MSSEVETRQRCAWNALLRSTKVSPLEYKTDGMFEGEGGSAAAGSDGAFCVSVESSLLRYSSDSRTELNFSRKLSAAENNTNSVGNRSGLVWPSFVS
mmetsp:Transcript_742/g.2155  ORF Transcript_742/g.2155 Transcript_742/m.2155 type:complete len:97 (-) Transcript_742:458-748(-)